MTEPNRKGKGGILIAEPCKRIDVDLSKIRLEGIVDKFLDAARRADSEEDFKVEAVQILNREVLERFGLPFGKFEKGIILSGARGRVDVLYGHLFLEFEKPGILKTARGFNHAIGQLEKYIKGYAKAEKGLARYFGVAIDGFQIGFIRYIENEKRWRIQGPYEVNANNVMKLLEALRGLFRKPLDADYLIKDFGPDGNYARETIKLLYGKLIAARSERTKILFYDWKRVFSQVCAYSPDKVQGLETIYGLPSNADPECLLFTIHSYYALIMKLLAAEVASLYGEPFGQSYIRKLEDAYLRGPKELRDELGKLEEGGIFLKIGIVNFLEADYFSWYLNEWDDDVSWTVDRLIKELSLYEVGTAELEPERIKDLFKKLYQFLVPQKIRHDLGEYYTPDWLAELLINKIKYDGNLDKRVLDPACGSGTFLVLSIKKAREYLEEHFDDFGAALEKITENIVGFDLNPLAVLASRINYMIAIGEFIRHRKAEKIRIPVFLADSILVERRTTLYEEVYSLKTIAGEFRIPASIVKEDVLTNVLGTIEECVKGGYNKSEFKDRLKNEMKDLCEKDLFLLSELHEQLVNLEKGDRNRIWIRILKNSFAPIFEGKFDFVIGNPPWINWESLPASYREVTKDLWESYGLIDKSNVSGLGKVRRDIASLFVARCFSQYLNGSGNLGFLIPFNVLKTQGGSGFRKWLAYETNVYKIHEISELYPFEGATNRTGLILLRKGKTKFPIDCTTWLCDNTNGVSQDAGLKEINKITRRLEMFLYPIEADFPESPWMICSTEAYVGIKKIISRSHYRGHEGVNTALNGAFWVRVLSAQPNGLLIENVGEGKKTVKKEQAVVEKELVFPLIRGRDTKRWQVAHDLYIFVPHDPKTGKPLEEKELKVKYPKAYQHVMCFRKQMENRSLHQLWGKSNPFYSLYDIGEYTFSDCKVIWKDVSGKISAKGEFGGAAVPETASNGYLRDKTMIPDATLMFIDCSSTDEAHYIASILNSTYTRFIATAYSVLHVRAHILKYVGIQKYQRANKHHARLMELSKRAHVLTTMGKEKELRALTKEIDDTISGMYGVTAKEQKEIEKTLADLQGLI